MISILFLKQHSQTVSLRGSIADVLSVLLRLLQSSVLSPFGFHNMFTSSWEHCVAILREILLIYQRHTA